MKKELQIEHEHHVALLEKDYTNSINQLEFKVESLSQDLDKSNNLNNLLQEKLDQSYVEMKDLAAKTVESASGVRIIGNTTNENK